MKSHVTLPLVVDREIVGSLGIATFRRHREFPADFLSRLELVASVFASALYRTRAEASCARRKTSTAPSSGRSRARSRCWTGEGASPP